MKLNKAQQAQVRTIRAEYERKQRERAELIERGQRKVGCLLVAS
jgi:hypothetical protein